MTISGQPDLTETIIPNNLRALERVREKILNEIRRYGFCEQDTFAIALALTEALANGYKHGNRRDPDKSITVRYRISSATVTIEIEDEGEGFDAGCVPDPTDDAHISRKCGRGIRLMKAFLDDVRYSRRGTRVRLTKRAQAVKSGLVDLAMAS